MAVLIFLGCLLGGIAIGLPIAWALLLCGAALMFWLACLMSRSWHKRW